MISHSEEELREASKHLRYETEMCVTLATGLSTGILGEQNPLAFAALESVIVHARALRKFFFDEKPWKDDMLAEHFFDDGGQWKALRGDMPDVLKKNKDRMDQWVAHLTYARLSVTPEEKLWPVVEIANAVASMSARFFANAPRSRLDLQS